MIAARSLRLPAIAVPGVGSWQPAWAELLTGRRVTIVTDADTQGRTLAARIAADLAQNAEPEIVDLAPHRDDGYDLTDCLRQDPATAWGVAMMKRTRDVLSPREVAERAGFSYHAILRAIRRGDLVAFEPIPAVPHRGR